ncbi:DUF1854 domain-containing protein [Paenibacillus koleovorans]|uniref:DUF1854 domain-containing protein n=1 Tax=Paenibacillus koleovorans TaxID=121608 RepID=UPI000FD97B75|nr:DUF1854 domain-containing protein [Paenibacillus koleovorans]
METNQTSTGGSAEVEQAVGEGAGEQAAEAQEISYEIELLTPDEVRFVRRPGGMLGMEYKGVSYPEVLLYRTYPLSKSEQYLSVRQPKGEEIGILERLSDLDPASQAEVRTELRLRYLIPTVTRIVKIKQYPGMWVWELETSLGPIKLSMRNLHEHVQMIGADRILLSDLDGNRCEIPSVERLEPASQKQLSKIL